MTHFSATFFAVLCITIASASLIEDPIYIAPNDTIRTPTEVMQLARGEWGILNQGIGGRSNLNVHFDSNGILWIFFGQSSTAIVNEVWNYDIQNDLWRWVLGFNSTTQYKNWGTMGIPGADVYPGSRREAQSAMDLNGNIWFFGGRAVGSSPDNALFHYNTTSNEFTWIDGGQGSGRDTDPNIGEIGFASPDVWPGRTMSGCMQRDSENNLWLIGGRAGIIDSSTNAVYHYNTTSGWWTLVYGDVNDLVITNVTEGVFGGRNAPACTIDADDKIWIFGGTISGKQYNDLWAFDTKNRVWTVEFPGTEDTSESFVVTNRTFAEGNMPQALYGSAMVDRQDGTIMIAAGSLTNQVWLWHKTNKLWKFASGSFSLTSSFYKTRRQPGSTMGDRAYSGHDSGLSAGGQLIIVGGYYTSTMNDMWIVPQDVCANGHFKLCSKDATCTYVDFYPTCACNAGFEGNGRTCSPTSTPSGQPSSSSTPANQNTPGQQINSPERRPSGQFSSASSTQVGLLAALVLLSL